MFMDGDAPVMELEAIIARSCDWKHPCLVAVIFVWSEFTWNLAPFMITSGESMIKDLDDYSMTVPAWVIVILDPLDFSSPFPDSLAEISTCPDSCMRILQFPTVMPCC